MNTDQNQELTQLLHTALADSATAKPKLLDFIREALKEFIHEDRIESVSSVIIGNRPPNGYPLEDLQNKLLKIARDRGVEAAVSAFDRCTTDPQASFQYWALLEGICVEEETQIFDGVRLVPPPDTLSELSEKFNFTVSERHERRKCICGTDEQVGSRGRGYLQGDLSASQRAAFCYL